MAASFRVLNISRNNQEVLSVNFSSADKLLVVIPNARTSSEIYVCKSTEKQVLNVNN